MKRKGVGNTPKVRHEVRRKTILTHSRTSWATPVPGTKVMGNKPLYDFPATNIPSEYIGLNYGDRLIAEKLDLVLGLLKDKKKGRSD